MSFPLSQDVGYDPSLYVETQGAHNVLIHNFISHGETRPQFGLIRPLEFSAGREMSIEIGYSLNTAGALRDPVLMLVGARGYLYSAPLPPGDGRHMVQLSGSDLKLPGSTPVKAIILRGRLAAPAEGTTARWTLERFVLHADRAPEIELTFPQITSSPEGRRVAREVVRTGERLKLELKNPETPVRISLFDGQGKAVQTRDTTVSGTHVSTPLGEQPLPGLWRAEVNQGPRRAEFRFLVLGKIPPHPRLMLSSERMTQLRGDSQYAGVREQIHQRARKLASSLTYSTAVGENIELMPSGSGILPSFPGQLKPYMEVLTDYGTAAAFNGLDYSLNGNREALAAARRALLTTARWKAWVQPRFRNHGLHTYYEVGVFTQLLAFGYDLIADELSPEERATVADAFWEKSIKPTIEEYFLYNRMPIGATNHEAQSLGGAIAAAVAVAGDVPAWEERERPALAQLTTSFEELLEGLFPGDGSEAEPIGYENFARQGLSWGMAGLDSLGIRPIGTQQLFDGFWWPYYATAWRGRQLGTGDFDGHLKGLSGFSWAAEHAGIPALQSFYEAGTQLDLTQGSEVGSNGHLLEEMLGPLDLACCSHPAAAAVAPPPSRVFPLRGSAALRSGWGPDSTVISLRVGPWFNHEHHDQGSFQVAAFGEDLIAEAGHANYYTDPRYPDYFTQAAGHNTLLIDGDPFSQMAFASRFWPGFSHPGFTSELLTGAFDYLSADLASAYDGRLQRYQRQFLYLKPDILIIRDRVAAGQPHGFSFLLHAPAGSDVAIAGSQASIKARKASALVAAGGTNATWKQALDPIAAELFTDLDHKKMQPRRQLSLASSRTSSTEFLVAMRFVRGSQGNALETWKQPAGEGFRAPAEGASEAIFRTGTGKLQVGTLATDGEILARNAMNGQGGWLAVGAREVVQGNQPVLTATAPADVAAAEAAGVLQLYLHNSAAGRVAVFRPERPRSVEVDGQSVSFDYRDTMVVLPVFQPGEHRVVIH